MERKLDKAKQVLLSALKMPRADFEIYVMGNGEIEKLRRELMLRADFKGREARKIAAEKVVNVLAFPEPPGFPDPGARKLKLGEVYLNRDFLPPEGLLKKGARPAAAERYAVLGPLLVHGLLHLLGYLHFSKRDTMKMQKKERKLWGLISSLD